MPRPFWMFALFAAASWAQTRTYTPQPPAPEDPELRREAVRLMERAWHVSTPDRWLPHEQILHIKAVAPSAGGPSEGDFRSYRLADDQKRFETDYGDYHKVDITVGHQTVEIGSRGRPTPAIVQRAREITPVFRGRFDATDIIRTIRDSAVGGRPARCIEFETVAGEELQKNEACVDGATGALVLMRQDNATLLQSDFFEYAGALFPGRMVRLVNDAEELEIDQKVIAMTEFPPGTFEIPAGMPTNRVWRCQQMLPAAPLDAPQPPVGAGPGVVDVVIRGFVDAGGHIQQPSVLESTRPDLNQAALELIQKWTFEPSRCDGKVSWWWGTYRVQFKGY